jgi:short subunit dehydrogenase-like uncharacterized protein
VDANVLLIPCCGFDSVPADVGTVRAHTSFIRRPFVIYFKYVSFIRVDLSGVYEAVKMLKGATKVNIHQYVETEKSNFSTGTVKTILNSILPQYHWLFLLICYSFIVIC